MACFVMFTKFLMTKWLNLLFLFIKKTYYFDSRFFVNF
jgi:hypothetical protein